MQGIVTDEKGSKVKAAIVVLLKVKDPDDDDDAEIATYAETDDEGRFMIQDLNQDDKYFIEIHVDHSESCNKKNRPEENQVPEPVEELEIQEQVEEAGDSEPVEAEEEPEAVDEKDEAKPAEETNPEYEAGKFEEEFGEEDLIMGYDEVVLEMDLIDPDDEMTDEIDIEFDGTIKEKYIIDSLKNDTRTDEAKASTICINNLYCISDIDLKNKLYLIKNNLW